MSRLKVIISGLIYPMTMLHWFWRAFERRDDIELYVLGPYTGSWIPWSGGMYLPSKYVKTPNFALPQSSISIKATYEFIERQLPEEWHNPDLWLQIDAGWHLINRPKAKIVAHIQTDPHVLKNHYFLPKSYSDFNFCMQAAYIRQDEKYLPYAFDPYVHFPEELEKEYHACMIGLHYEHRNALVNGLLQQKLKVYYNIGEIYDEYRDKYNRSKLALSWSSLDDTPARVFEAFGMGIPLICNRTSDLNNFFVEKDHYLGFSDVSDALSNVNWALNNYDEAAHMAESARRKASAGHTWDHRIQTILDVCGLKRL